MNEQEILKRIEEAQTIEEVWEAASNAGVDKLSFNALVEAVDNEQNDEISETDLENVNGGFGVILGGLCVAGVASLGFYIGRQLKKIRQSRYQTGYDEEIMSDNRLGGICENKK